MYGMNMPKSKNTIEEANMYRIVRGQVSRTRTGSVIEDSGYLKRAKPYQGKWVFSEQGAGVQELVLLGTRQQIMIFLAAHYDQRIENQIVDLPEIFMSVQPYTPGKRFKGLFPVGDTIVRLTEALGSFAPGSELTDLAGALKDIRDLSRFNLTVGSGENERLESDEVLYVKFSYLPGDHMYQIATGTVDMRSIRVLLENTF
jgi:hypothetical protein